ncbi:hypothetical protein [Lactiplantibacillus plantarum]|uniref:hypothetical protein n=1 Tax=Lactiplantibacillus plantarum TaxID=1590 RepID=UPI0030F31D22
MKYTNRHLNFINYCKSNDFWGLNYDEFRMIIDHLCLSIYYEGSKENLRQNQMRVWSPFNCVIAATKSKVIIGFSNDKAFFNNAIFIRLPDIELDDDYATAKMDSQTELLAGYKGNVYTSLPIDFLRSKQLKLLLKIAGKNLSLAEAIQKVVTGELNSNIDDSVSDPKNEIGQGQINDFTQDISEKLQCVGMQNTFISSAKSFVNNIIKGEHRMNFNPIFKARDLVVDDKMIFVALPFTKERLEIMDEVIKPALEKDKHMSVLRSGDMFGANLNIMENIWTYINTARVVIVDISDKNPNVFYELGICNTLGKDVITICDENSYHQDYNGKLPFDIIGNNVIFYQNHGSGPQKLVNTLEKAIDSVITGKMIINSTIS